MKKSLSVVLPRSFLEMVKETISLTDGVTMRSFAFQSLREGLNRLRADPQPFRTKKARNEFIKKSSKGFTVQLSASFVDEVNEMVFLTGGVTMRTFAYEALREGLECLKINPELFRAARRDLKDIDGI